MKKYALKDIVIAICILVSPLLLFFHELVPPVKVIDVFFIKIESGEYTDVSVIMWIAGTKILTTLLLIFWFLTCKHWWKLSILVPLIIELYKLYGVFSTNYADIDKSDFIYSLPLTLPIIIIVLIISNRLNYYSLARDIVNELDQEIDDVFIDLDNLEPNNLMKVSLEFSELQRNVDNIEKEEYLNRLIQLRRKLITSSSDE